MAGNAHLTRAVNLIKVYWSAILQEIQRSPSFDAGYTLFVVRADLMES